MKRDILTAIIILLVAAKAAQAQANGSSSEPQAGNPLSGLFTIAPQYQSGQQVEPQPASQGNPLSGVFSIAPQYQSGNSVNVQPPPDTANHFQNLFTNPAAYQSGVNVQPQPHFLDPTFIKDQIQNGYQPSATEKQMVEQQFPDFFKKDQPATAPAAKPAAQQPQAGGTTAAAAEKVKKKSNAKKKKVVKRQQAAPKPLVYDPLKDAVFLYQTGAYDKSLQILTGYLKNNPTDSQGHYLSAINLAAQGNNQLAADEYRAVIKFSPTTRLAQQAAEGLRKINGDMPAAPHLPPLRTK